MWGCVLGRGQHEKLPAEGRPWAKKGPLGSAIRVRVSEWTHQLPVLKIGLGWGLGALLLVHGAQELLHIRGQKVIHFVALDREGWGWRL